MIKDTAGEVHFLISYQIKNWKKDLKNIKLDPTLKWKIAEIIEINESDIAFKIIDSKITGKLFSKDLKWAYKKRY